MEPKHFGPIDVEKLMGPIGMQEARLGNQRHIKNALVKTLPLAPNWMR